jgi:diguanylate cyclase (GGDEF)-like protein/PAS domain S-box-containing protein
MNDAAIQPAVQRPAITGALTVEMQSLGPLAEHLPLVVYVCDGGDETTPRFVNDQLRRLLGIADEDLRAADVLWYAHLHPEDREPVLADIAASRAVGAPFYREYRLLRADDAEIWVSDHARALPVAGAAAVVYVGVIKDITERKQMHLALWRSLELNDAILGTIPDLVVYLDRNLIIRRVSESCGDAYGLHPRQMEGRPLQDICDQETAQQIRPLLQRCIDGERVRAELWMELAAPGRRCMDLLAAPHRDADGNVDGIVYIGRDVTGAVHARKALDEGEQRFRNLTKNIPGVILRYLTLTNGRSRVLYVSDACRDLWEVDAALLMQDVALLWSMVVPDDVEALRGSLERSARDLCDWEHAWRIRTPSGRNKWLQGRGKPRAVANGGVVWDSVIMDVTARKSAEEALDNMAHKDHLTGLPNRLSLHKRLREALERNRARDGMLALLFIDLDNFKQVNDSFGHSAGDRLLSELTAALGAVVPPAQTFARISGDEFAVVFESLRDRQQAEALASALLDAAQASRFFADGQEISLTLSIGIALAPVDADDTETMLQMADTAMYRAKSQGRNRLVFYDKTFTDEVQQRIAFESGLRKALAEDGLVLHYQPQIDIATGEVLAVEALLRWRHPERGILMPVDFLEIAEGSGIMGAIGEWVLAEAFATYRGWLNEGKAPARLALNVSAKQVADRQFPGQVKVLLDAFALPSEKIELELSEDLLVDEGGDSQSVLEELARMGVSMAIDDFGTGRSSLAYLRRLPLRRIKIDRSFIADLPDPDAAAIVRGIIMLARSLRLDVIAEGVETYAQARFLAANGCPAGQGYLYAEPQSEERIALILAGLGPDLARTAVG